MSLKLPKLKEVVTALSLSSAGVAMLVVNEEGWELVSDPNRGVSGYLSASYNLLCYDDDATAYLREIAECMLRDVKADYASKS
jgi:hypothetical protein